MAGHFDYHRTVVAYHGTTRDAADALVEGRAFEPSTGESDWLGRGVYFWEYGPRQAWRWAGQRHGDEAAVVGAMVRLGRCLDLLDPENARIVRDADAFAQANIGVGRRPRRNVRARKYRDCLAFNAAYAAAEINAKPFDSARAVFVPLRRGGLPRLWEGSGVFDDAHIQINVRNPRSILAVWHVRSDGSYGRDETR